MKRNIIAFCLSLLISVANASEWELDSFYSTTHTPYIKSSESLLMVKWEAAENEDWSSFWCAFSESSPVTIDIFYDADYDNISARSLNSWENFWTRSLEISDDGNTPYYFNLSILDNNASLHPVPSIGPFYVDTEPPGNSRFTVSETTSSPNVILKDIGATDAVQFCISNSGFDVCTWENLTGTQRLWSVNNELNAQTTIYMQFKDDVGNISNVSRSTTYTITENDTDVILGVRAIPALMDWGILIFAFVLIVTAIFCMRFRNNLIRAN